MNWYKITNENIQKQFFLDRTKKHISLVQKAAKKIVKKYPEFSKLIGQVKKHDESKFEEPELIPYISLTWKKTHKDSDNAKELSHKEEKAMLHHFKVNSHHPEYHLENKESINIDSSNIDKLAKCVDVSFMPDIDIAEMIADWQAVSEELKTGTPREWLNKQKDVRWSFSKKQEKLIDKLIKTFEK